MKTKGRIYRLDAHRSRESAFHAAFDLLLQAHRLSEKLKSNPWEFAVPIADFRAAGVTCSTLIALLKTAYVEHAYEQTLPESTNRKFRRPAGLRVSEQSCFILTASGISAAALQLEASPTLKSAQDLLPAAPLKLRAFDSAQATPPRIYRILTGADASCAWAMLR